MELARPADPGSCILTHTWVCAPRIPPLGVEGMPEQEPPAPHTQLAAALGQDHCSTKASGTGPPPHVYCCLIRPHVADTS